MHIPNRKRQAPIQDFPRYCPPLGGEKRLGASKWLHEPPLPSGSARPPIFEGFRRYFAPTAMKTKRSSPEMLNALPFGLANPPLFEGFPRYFSPTAMKTKRSSPEMLNALPFGLAQPPLFEGFPRYFSPTAMKTKRSSPEMFYALPFGSVPPPFFRKNVMPGLIFPGTDV